MTKYRKARRSHREDGTRIYNYTKKTGRPPIGQEKFPEGTEVVEVIERKRGKRPRVRKVEKSKALTAVKVNGSVMRKQVNAGMDELLAKIPVTDMEVALINNYGNPVLAANQLKVHWTVVYRYLKHFPELQMARELGKEAVLDLAESKNIEQLLEGGKSNVLFTLRTLGKDRGYTWDSREKEAPKRKIKVVAPDQRKEIDDIEIEENDK